MENLLNKIDLEFIDVNFNTREIDFDWRREVPTEIQTNWETLTDREKKLVYIMAKKLDENYWENRDNESRSSIY